MKDLSVIIPVYNTEKYLCECVDSVLREVPQNSEIILVDDGSPDNCPKICDDYAKKDSRIVVLHQENKGLSGARNSGIEVASGKSLFFIDSDDFLPSGYFEKLLSFNSDLVISSYRAFYQDGTPDIYGELETKQYQTLNEYLLDFHKYFATTFNFAWGKVYDNNIIKKFNLRFLEGVSMVEDVLFNIEYYKYCSSITTVKDAYVHYRQIKGTLSKNISHQVFDWYVHSYREIKNLLLKTAAFTIENEDHFYTHFMGNVLECLIGYWNQPSEDRREKYTKIIQNELLQQAIPYGYSKRVKRILSALKRQDIRKLEKSVKNYIFWINLRKKIRSILR